MDIFGVLNMLGGLALFLFGMNTMGESLTKLSGGKLEGLLERLTSTRIKGLLLGALVTAIIQSSSATTVMVVGFVNSGIMELSRAVGVIMGANIGTTVTSWILSLMGISGDNVFVRLLEPSSFSPILAAIGIILIMTANSNEKKKTIGNILLGFAVLMFGMSTMSGAVKPLASNTTFTGILTMFSNPFLGLVAGAVLTAVIQSSSASIGILQSLCLSGALEYKTAIPIIMGQNIGTCITAIISSVGAGKNAKKASMIHLYFNLIGSVVFMIVFYTINAFVHFEFLDRAASVFGIALIHTLFNVLCTICMFPFANGLVKLASLSIGKDEEKISEIQQEREALPNELLALDELFLREPAYALELSKKAANRMADDAKESLFLALGLCTDYTKEKVRQIEDNEARAEKYGDVIGSYLVKISAKNLPVSHSRTLSVLIQSISDFERIAHHATTIAQSIETMQEKGEHFSKKAQTDIEELTDKVQVLVDISVSSFLEEDVQTALLVKPLEEELNRMDKKVRRGHIKRVQKGKCTIKLGIILEDIITSFERVASHCSNIADSLIEIMEE